MEDVLETREFEYRERDFRRAQRLIKALVGISLPDGKRDLVYSRLARVVRSRSLSSIGEYLDLAEADPDEIGSFINALTTNLTSFFREPHHFTTLRELAASRVRLRVWSAACSTGEEPYSIAMTLAQAGRANSTIVASDIDTNCLDKARLGVYPEGAVRPLSHEIVARFFLQGTAKREGYVRVRDELRSMIDFRQMNLISPPPGLGSFSVIFCRNVLIYFDRETRRKVIDVLWECLEPNGLLFTGHAENIDLASELFTRIGTTTYRRLSP